jgi:hypothetical protein
MKTSWDPNERDIANVIKQINDGNLFAYFIDHCKEGHDLTIVEKMILDMGFFTVQYGQWQQFDIADCTWAHFDEFLTHHLNLWHETTRTAS